MVLSSYVGATVRRKEDPRLITGSSHYVDDLKLQNMAYLAIVRSPYAHARIKSIDATEALAMPGVVAVLTATDLKRVMKILYTEAAGSETGEHASQEVGASASIPVPEILPLANDRVRYVGEGVAAVVAESQQIAEDAISAVFVDYEPLAAVVDPEDALKPGAPRIYDEVKGNVSVIKETVAGDFNAAWNSAAIKVKARVKSPRVHPMPMEPRGAVFQMDPMTGGMTFWTSTQAPHWNRNEIAKALGIPQSLVRCIAPEVGGGFGCKIGCYQEEYVGAVACKMLNRPIKWIETRSENFLVTNHGRNQFGDFEIAADANGKVTGLRARVLLDSGAYPKGLDLAWATWVMSTGPYDIKNLDYRVTGVYTNTMANGAYRGAGRPEAAFYLERLMDMVADEGGLDPAEVRRANFIAPDRFPFTTLSGEHYDTGEYDKPLTKALEVINYPELLKLQADARKQGRLVGIGVATYVEICGFGPYESATVRVEPSGDVSIFTGISPHGQGQETTFSQLAADYIGADFDGVFVHHGDTATTPQGNGTMGSRGLAVGGAAVARALTAINEKAKRIAAFNLEAAVEDIELSEGKFRVKGVPSPSLTLADIAGVAYSGDLPEEIEAGLYYTDFFKPADETFPFGAHISLIEVLPETGEVKILRYVSVDDCGTIISPMLVTGQVHGGLAQGIGQALLEELHYDNTGELITATLTDYAVPKAWHFPTFETHHTTTTTPLNPLGAKGIGEAATIGATPCIANAVNDALSPLGVKHLDIPFGAEKVWRAIQNATKTASAAD